VDDIDRPDVITSAADDILIQDAAQAADYTAKLIASWPLGRDWTSSMMTVIPTCPVRKRMCR
jgi:hypothetical protein